LSRKNRSQRRAAAAAFAAVQTPVPGRNGTAVLLAEDDSLPPTYIPEVRPPRPFGKPRVYQLDGGYTVTIEGDADALEQEFSVSAENDQLHVFTADAAIERRIAKQSRSRKRAGFHRPLSRLSRSRSDR
jgi:hypothetical protein